ncbi:hypothetical protein Micbo1qcDRAFT_232903 [Microdochium bolleyi]|uniref:NAD-dependent epimerase/dehydratase domain-containing protein n=1 Tax=Microdochium bolleyi TaxID=196109 RepID=A0A136J858_9PEZI|nr:hypothetical protein Micbo1qcDRAFT_232903 [Microdochium bolleyi]
MTSKGPILITGFNGYLGGRTAETALKSGYPVRGTVRKLESGQKTKDALVALGYDAGLIDIVEVPVIAATGAFDKVVAGCSSVIHVAAPMGPDVMSLPPPEVVRIATDATTGIVDSALRHAGPGLQSIVLMSSAGTLTDFPPRTGFFDETHWAEGPYNIVTNPEALAKIEPQELKPMLAYLAAKTGSERAFWRKKEELAAGGGDMSKVSFTALQAPWFIGPPIVPWESAEALPYSASFVHRVLAGEDPAACRMGFPTAPNDASVDVRDVARVLVWAALNPDKADGERFMCSGATGGAQAVADILDRESQAGGGSGSVPELKGYVVKNKGTPGQWYNPDYSVITDGSVLEFDGSKVTRATGQDYIPFEKSVLDTVKAAFPLVVKT